LSDKLLAWLSVHNKVQMIGIVPLMPLPPHCFFCFIKIEVDLTFLVLVLVVLVLPLLGCPGKQAVKWMFV